jgi:DNA replication and repair protein RecF
VDSEQSCLWRLRLGCLSRPRAIAAHLDPARCNALYARLERLGAQVWMSGADPALFEAVAPAAAWFEVSPGRAERRS